MTEGKNEKELENEMQKVEEKENGDEKPVSKLARLLSWKVVVPVLAAYVAVLMYINMTSTEQTKLPPPGSQAIEEPTHIGLIGERIVLQHSNETHERYDTEPAAAIHITPPGQPTTRNYSTGIWVETHGAKMDKGRGLMINNWGASDSIYIQQDGEGGVGLASLNNADGNVGVVIENRAQKARAIELRQGPNGGQSSLCTLQANMPGAAELLRINTRQKDKVGVIFRFHEESTPIVIQEKSGTEFKTKFKISSSGEIHFAGGVLRVDEEKGLIFHGAKGTVTELAPP